MKKRSDVLYNVKIPTIFTFMNRINSILSWVKRYIFCNLKAWTGIWYFGRACHSCCKSRISMVMVLWKMQIKNRLRLKNRWHFLLQEVAFQLAWNAVSGDLVEYINNWRRNKGIGQMGVTLSYRGFLQCILICSTDAQNIAPVGNQLLHPWYVVICVAPWWPVWCRQNRLIVSTKWKWLLQLHTP